VKIKPSTPEEIAARRRNKVTRRSVAKHLLGSTGESSVSVASSNENSDIAEHGGHGHWMSPEANAQEKAPKRSFENGHTFRNPAGSKYGRLMTLEEVRASGIVLLSDAIKARKNPAQHKSMSMSTTAANDKAKDMNGENIRPMKILESTPRHQDSDGVIINETEDNPSLQTPDRDQSGQILYSMFSQHPPNASRYTTGPRNSRPPHSLDEPSSSEASSMPKKLMTLKEMKEMGLDVVLRSEVGRGLHEGHNSNPEDRKVHFHPT
jgi:hypothetical protein